MLYDEAYSFDVSLSEIFDEFLQDDTSPEVVLNFLSNYLGQLNELFKNSICYKRLFQVDFYLRCSSDARKELINIAKRVPARESAYLCWQLCSKYFSDMLTLNEKSIVKDQLQRVLKTHLPHPYANRHEIFVRDFDEMCAKCIRETKSLRTINQFIDPENCTTTITSYDIFGRYQGWYKSLQKVDSSLFKWRMLQYDVFENLGAMQKYLYITMLPNLNYVDLEDIQLQIYDSTEDVDVKFQLYDKVTSKWKQHQMFAKESPVEHVLKNDPEIKKIVESSSTFEEIQLQLSLLGILPPFKKIALWCLLNEKKKILKGWYDYDKEQLDTSLNISGLVQNL